MGRLLQIGIVGLLLVCSTGCISVIRTDTCRRRQVVVMDGQWYVVDVKKSTAKPIDLTIIESSETVETIEIIVDFGEAVSGVGASDMLLSGSGGSAGRIEFLSPAPDTTISGDVNIQASVSDADGLATIEWLVDGVSVLVSSISGNSSGVSYLWKTATVSGGRHTITVVITDARGNRATANLDLFR